MPYRDPEPEELNSPLFNAIWNVIKDWDINVPDQYQGYTTASGNHVCAIMDVVLGLGGPQADLLVTSYLHRMMTPFSPEKVIDRKFIIMAVNPVNGKVYTENNSLLLCAKDAAVPTALIAYRNKCAILRANQEHIDSIQLLIGRVVDFQDRQGGGRIPDTIGDEVPRCLRGEGL